MSDDVPQREKDARLKAIGELQEQIQTEINAELEDESVEVLVGGA